MAKLLEVFSKWKVAVIVGAIVVLLGVSLLIFKDFRQGLIGTIGETYQSTLVMLGIAEKGRAVEGEDIVKTPEEVEQLLFPRKEDNLVVHVLDTRGDAVILVDGRDVMLINGGFKEDAPKIKRYLAKLGVKKLRYVLATNYHQSSIGGLPALVKDYHSDFFLLAENVTHDAKGRALRNQLDSQGDIWSTPTDAGIFKLGNTTFEMKLTHDRGSSLPYIRNGKTTMVFAGTATILDAAGILKFPEGVDLLSVNGANQDYQLPEALLHRMTPKVTTLSNKTPYSTVEEKDLIKGYDTELFTTEECGTIVIGSNGEDLVIDCAK